MAFARAAALITVTFACVGCAPAPPVCATRSVLPTKIPAGATDCGSFHSLSVDGVLTPQPAEALACANRALAARTPFVVRQLGMIGSPCHDDQLCPLVAAPVGAWIGAESNGSYRVTQIRDEGAPATERSCAVSAAATLRWIVWTVSYVSLTCDSGDDLHARPPTALCSTQ